MIRSVAPALLLAALAFGQNDGSLPKVLWREPGRLTVQDWVCGPGGCGRTPAPPFHFVREDKSGTNSKVVVRDSRGLTWSVKFGAEVIPETFGSRFVNALGYFTQPTYYVDQGKIEGISSLGRSGRFIHSDGSFTRARFELRGEPDFVFLNGQSWAWNDPPFRGSHQIKGLKIVMMLLSNWDAKDARDGSESNNGVFRVSSTSGRPELAYSVSDWGDSLGRWGHLRRRDQSDCSGYAQDTRNFVKGVSNNQVEWGYSGKHEEDISEGITVDDVRWLLPYLNRITHAELEAGLKASGATPRQTACWAWSIENRIQQLQAVAR